MAEVGSDVEIVLIQAGHTDRIVVALVATRHVVSTVDAQIGYRVKVVASPVAFYTGRAVVAGPTAGHQFPAGGTSG